MLSSWFSYHIVLSDSQLPRKVLTYINATNVSRVKVEDKIYISEPKSLEMQKTTTTKKQTNQQKKLHKVLYQCLFQLIPNI